MVWNDTINSSDFTLEREKKSFHRTLESGIVILTLFFIVMINNVTNIMLCYQIFLLGETRHFEMQPQSQFYCYIDSYVLATETCLWKLIIRNLKSFTSTVGCSTAPPLLRIIMVD